MNNCAFLTMDSLDDFECYDKLLDQPLAEIGWNVTYVPWRDASIDWNQYDLVVIRSCWDYQKDSDQFLEVLESIDQSSARLENNLELVCWNIHKSYLRDLEMSDVNIVPTLWSNALSAKDVSQYFEHFNTEEIIIKPCISAGAENTYRIHIEEQDSCLPSLLTTFAQKDYMVQPFIPNIITEGEYSLMYFSGKHSHSILKTPKLGDFRVQEEYGSRLLNVVPDEKMQNLSNKALKSLPEIPLYARVDMVRDGDDYFIMELELIEPSLYFNMDPASVNNFVSAFAQRYP
jgi:glutathione synthase/RimK-type ligase-like ATP-grasp enzyme